MRDSLKIIIGLVLLLLLVEGLVFCFSKKSQQEFSNIQSFMKLTSPAFENNQPIPQKYTCDGENLNPPLEINQTPEGTKSLVLIVDDPDAPRGTFTHWIMWNIDPSVKKIEEGKTPEGIIEGKNDFNNDSYGYSGPCPASGAIHHYHFKLYALDTTLNLSPSSTKMDIEKAMEGHILDKTELIGLYQRR